MKATIYFDKSETGAKSFEFDSFSERVSDNSAGRRTVRD